MLADGDHPLVDRSAKGLGVRVPGDVEPDHENMVHPGGGGMSVAPCWQMLPTHRIPKRLRAIARDAAGSDNLRCWRYGEGNFVNGAFADRLQLSLTSPTHANVEPFERMPLETFDQALRATRENWSVDEEPL